MISLINAPVWYRGASLLTWAGHGSTLPAMDEDDFFSIRPQSLLAQLSSEDLGPLSIDELQERIAQLKEEIARVEQHMIDAARHRSAAEDIFKKP
jgi:uncharacterized small protein (DUF1192 family)